MCLFCFLFVKGRWTAKLRGYSDCWPSPGCCILLVGLPLTSRFWWVSNSWHMNGYHCDDNDPCISQVLLFRSNGWPSSDALVFDDRRLESPSLATWNQAPWMTWVLTEQPEYIPKLSQVVLSLLVFCSIVQWLICFPGQPQVQWNSYARSSWNCSWSRHGNTQGGASNSGGWNIWNSGGPWVPSSPSIISHAEIYEILWMMITGSYYEYVIILLHDSYYEYSHFWGFPLWRWKFFWVSREPGQTGHKEAPVAPQSSVGTLGESTRGSVP